MKWVALVAGLACAAEASAQAFNLDFGSGTVPDTSYGAGAEQNGHWNQVRTIPGALLDTNGNATAATQVVTMSSGGGTIDGAVGDDALLMNDFFYASSAGPGSISLLSIIPGDYVFYLYGWASHLDGPGGTNGQTTFDIGIPGGNSKIVTLDYSGPWPGMQVEGNTFAKVQVHIPDFATFILIGLKPAGEGISIIQGMQIVPIPAPPVAVVGLVGGVALVWRRR